MIDDLHLEEVSVRVSIEKMDEAFCSAMQTAFYAGAEDVPTVVSKKPGTKNPKEGLQPCD